MTRASPWTIATVLGIASILYILSPSVLPESSDIEMFRKSSNKRKALAGIKTLHDFLKLELGLAGSSDSLILTSTLFDMLASLNEPVDHKKTISPWPVLAALERIYRSRISTSQHDAHEMLHLVLETLDTEAKKLANAKLSTQFPFCGSTIDRITCSVCGYSPRTSKTPFLVLSLTVPQKRSASLDSLISSLTEPEYIKDYGCVNCRLKASGLLSTSSQLDPDTLPLEIETKLPSITSAITKATSFHVLPSVLALHLSRSIYGGFGASRNSCKVSLTEYIKLKDGSGAIVQYKLSALIRHKGTHQTGHYECFRRKLAPEDIPRRDLPSPDNYSPNSRDAHLSSISLPTPESTEDDYFTTTGNDNNSSKHSSGPNDSSSNLSTPGDSEPDGSCCTKNDASSAPSALPFPSQSVPSPASVSKAEGSPELSKNSNSQTHLPQPPTKPPKYQWWKISDDKVWECSIKDVLREESGVYLLFYEKC